MKLLHAHKIVLQRCVQNFWDQEDMKQDIMT
jgi:hypothetical protein